MDDHLSVFHVDDCSEAEHLTVLWAPTVLDSPQSISYLLLPDDCFARHGLTAVSTPDPSLHPFLSARHFEVSEIDEEKAHLMAGVLLQSWQGAPPVRAMARATIRDAARSLAENDPEFMDRIMPRWRRVIWPDASA